MFATLFRICVLTCLIATGFLSTYTHAGELTFLNGNSEQLGIPIYLMEIFPTINEMIEELGGEKVRLPDEIFSALKKVSSVVNEALLPLCVNEKIKELKSPVQEALEKKLLRQSSPELFEFLTAANFLNQKDYVQRSVRVWATSYKTLPSRFNDLVDDVKEIIIERFTPTEFMAFVAANNKEKEQDLEGWFKIALKVHYEDGPPNGVTARKHYEGLKQTSGFVRIPGGEYEIGSPDTEANHQTDERLHRVTLSPFWIMEAAVAQEQYAKKMGKNPSIPQNGQTDLPVENITWAEAEAYAKSLSKDDPKFNYHLVSEAQLEVVFRGGTKTAYVSGHDASRLRDYVWHDKNAGGQTRPVKSKLANSYGIYRGSVWEWTGDWYDKDYIGSEGLDPKGPTSGSYRVVRGGSFCSDARRCRSACRDGVSPGCRDGRLGFRLVRTKK